MASGSCAEAALIRGAALVEGPVAVDVDGPDGPLLPSWLACSGPLATLPHNFPNETLIRGPRTRPTTYPIAYRSHISILLPNLTCPSLEG